MGDPSADATSAAGDVNSNLLITYRTGDSQLDKAIWQWLTWDKVSLGRGHHPGLLSMPLH